MNTEISYILDKLTATKCVVEINVQECTYHVELIRYNENVLSPIGSTSIEINSDELQWLTFPATPLPSGEFQELIILHTETDERIKLRKKNVTMSISHAAWSALKELHKGIVEELHVVRSYIAQPDTVIKDKYMLSQLLLACANHRYSILIAKYCKMCGYKHKYIRYAEHQLSCIRSNTEKKTALATEALDSITDHVLASVLHTNNMGTSGLSVEKILGSHKKRFISRLIENRCYLPIGDTLVLYHVRHLQRFYDLF